LRQVAFNPAQGGEIVDIHVVFDFPGSLRVHLEFHGDIILEKRKKSNSENHIYTYRRVKIQRRRSFSTNTLKIAIGSSQESHP
jgi:hypothetical protein